MSDTSRTIDEEAALWAVRLSAGPLSAHERRELDGWLTHDARHDGALIRARATWVDLDRYAALSGRTPPVRKVGPPQAQPPHRRWFLAAAVLALTGMGGWLAQQIRGNTYVSEVGEQRHVVLEDGSSITLNTATQAVVNFDEARREVHLERGEALFEVAKDPHRPFVVHAGDVQVTAVGTAFTVRRYAGGVDVMVTEGIVEVVRHDGEVTYLTEQVEANQEIVLPVASATAEIRTVERAESKRRLAWRNGMIIFDGEPLSEAVAELNRHNTRRIVVEDETLAARPIVGIFQATDTETFVRAATAALDAQAVDGGDIITLQPAH